MANAPEPEALQQDHRRFSSAFQLLRSRRNHGHGNLLNDSFHRYTWDNESNPVTVDGNPITYDALNRRVEYYKSSVGYVQYLWAPYNGTRLLIESSAGPQVQLPLPGGGQAMVGPSASQITAGRTGKAAPGD